MEAVRACTLLGEQLVSEPIKHSNNAVTLLAKISSDTASKDEIKAAIRALGLFFQHSLSSGVLQLSKETKTVAKEQAAYAKWLNKHFSSYLQLLGKCLGSTHPTAVKVASLTALMELCRASPQKNFAAAPLNLALTAMISKESAQDVLPVFTSAYLQYIDVRYHVWKLVSSAVKSRLDSTTLTARPPSSLKDVPEDLLARNIYTVLCSAPAATPGKKRKQLPGEEAAEEPEEMKSWCGQIENGTAQPSNRSEGSQKRRKRQRTSQSNEKNDESRDDSAVVSAKWVTSGFQKRAFSEAWLSFMRLQIPPDTFRKVLVKLHEDVIPFLSNPLQLADLLSGALDSGGILGMTALHAIFVLVTKYGLEYPQFYTRLYQLLKPEVFLAKYRSRFFQLADVFLSSTLVPAYIIGSFIKRFARLALTAPPAGALVCVGFIHNLLRRHPSCLVLLDRPTPSQATEPPKEISGQDPFLEDEEDPALTRALESSLWELKSLSNHYYNQVSAVASQTLDKDLQDKKKTSEVDMTELIKGSYSSLTSNELSRRLKQIPVAFYSTPPQGLFDSSTAADFPGWSF